MFDFAFDLRDEIRVNDFVPREENFGCELPLACLAWIKPHLRRMALEMLLQLTWLVKGHAARCATINWTVCSICIGFVVTRSGCDEARRFDLFRELIGEQKLLVVGNCAVVREIPDVD